MRSLSFPRRTAFLLVTGLAVAPLVFPVVEAHPRARRHTHRVHAHVHRGPVLVIGAPRPAKRVVVIDGRAHGTLDMNVKPKATEVWVDGTFRGTCDAFDGHPDKLHLLPGPHTLKLVTPDGVEVEREIRVQARTEFNVGLDLR